MSEVEATSQEKSLSYSVRVRAKTVLRLELLSAVYAEKIGHLVDQMVAKNFQHIKDTGKLDAYMAEMEQESEEP
jgi:23S rRNA maturation-related 3'-5' exoribonuclease YhaM